jgi:hypothetical protein
MSKLSKGQHATDVAVTKLMGNRDIVFILMMIWLILLTREVKQ